MPREMKCLRVQCAEWLPYLMPGTKSGWIRLWGLWIRKGEFRPWFIAGQIQITLPTFGLVLENRHELDGIQYSCGHFVYRQSRAGHSDSVWLIDMKQCSGAEDMVSWLYLVVLVNCLSLLILIYHVVFEGGSILLFFFIKPKNKWNRKSPECHSLTWRRVLRHRIGVDWWPKVNGE